MSWVHLCVCVCVLVWFYPSVWTKYMWAGSTSNEAGQLGGVRASNHAGFGLGESSAATSYPEAGGGGTGATAGTTTTTSNPPILPRPPSLPPPAPPAAAPVMPYPWDHHHLRHHEEVAVSPLDLDLIHLFTSYKSDVFDHHAILSSSFENGRGTKNLMGFLYFLLGIGFWKEIEETIDDQRKWFRQQLEQLQNSS